MRPPRSLVLAVAALVAATTLAACSSSSSDGAKTPATATSAPGPTTSTTTAPPPVTKAERALLDARPVEFALPTRGKPTAAKPAPLVVLLHGYGVTGEVQDAYLKFTPAATAAGMVTAHPDGTPNALGKRYWNATDACCAGPRSKVDDSAYIAAIIHEAKARYAIDPKRVYVVGHSNGGFMAYRMACDHADEVAAIASIAGATWNDPKQCTPSEPVSVLEVHGRADDQIAYDGGAIAGHAYPSVDQTVATWVRYDGCSATPDPSPSPATRAIVARLPPASVVRHSKGCKPGGGVELWDQPEGSHIPIWAPTFSSQLVAWLQQHPKP